MAYNKYYIYKEMVSNDEGVTWLYTGNEAPSGNSIGVYQTLAECEGSLPPSTEYRWVNMDSSVDYYCSGTDKYYKQKKQVSIDGGVSWADVTPAEYQMGGLAETDSIDCGYVPPVTEIYRWIDLDPTEQYICDGTGKYYKQQKQVSYDNGSTWSDVYPAEFQKGDIISYNADDCYPPMEIIDMTGKLYVSRLVDGSYYRVYNCSGEKSNIISPENYGGGSYNIAVTGAYLASGVGDYIYIGSCGCCGIQPYSLRGYVSAPHNIAVYFADGRTYGLPRGMFLGMHIREVVLGGENITFSIMYDATGGEGIFQGASGDISKIVQRLDAVSPKCFSGGSFGDSATFGEKVTLYAHAFENANFSNITFDAGFSLNSGGDWEGTFDNVFRDLAYSSATITLNGMASDYPENAASNIESATLGFCTVIDNTTT